MQTRNKKKQTMLLYFLQEGPIADFIVLPSPLRTEMWRLHLVVTICEKVVHVHDQPFFNMGWKHSLL